MQRQPGLGLQTQAEPMCSSDVAPALAWAPFPWPPLTRVALAASVRFKCSSLNPSSAACVREEGKRTEAMITSAPKQLHARQKVFIYMYFILFVRH